MLLEEIGIDSKELTSQSIGFQIGPRINAAGRMKHANIALSLLMTEDKDMAREISKNLDLNNKDRKSLIDKIIKESEKQIENTEDCCLTILGHDWPLGVVGLVSGRLTDRYYRPALVMTDRGNDISGSGRSIEELNIIEVLQELEDYLAHYGGHPQACGFTLKSKECYDDFCNAFRSIVSKKINYDELLPKVDIDAHILLKNITWDLQESLEKFEPFGEANPSPKFMLSSLTVEGVALLGKNENHLRLMVSQDGFGPKKMLGFFMGNEWGPQIKIGDTLDAIVEISVNQWNGTQELELRIINLKLHK